jgi:hypothetical protein
VSRRPPDPSTAPSPRFAVFFYLAIVFIVYAGFLLARHLDRRSRQAFATRLAANYRLRNEFWRVRGWQQAARERGDADAAERFGLQAARLVARVTGECGQMRLEHQPLAYEIGWTAGMLDDELADMGRAVASSDLSSYERWMTGRDRAPVDAVLNPRPGIADDELSGRIHLVIGVIVGALGGFVAWVVTYWGETAVRTPELVLFVLLGAVVLGHVAREAKGTLWDALLTVTRPIGW